MNDFLLFFNQPHAVQYSLTISSWLAAVATLGIALLFTTVRDAFLKAFAILLMSAVAFMADNGFVYSLIVLIVASLIADNHYLQNIVALLTNRSWWKDRPALPSEREAKITKEVEAVAAERNKLPEKIYNDKDTPSRFHVDLKPENIKRIVREVMESEAQVLSHLHSLRLFSNFKVFQERALVSKKTGRKIIIDMIARGDTQDIVIEVKYEVVNSKAVLRQLHEATVAYEQKNAEEGRTVPVRSLLVIPDEVSNKQNISFEHDQRIGILFYNKEDGSFVNEKAIAHWLSESE